jgi:hypothetical protein
MSVYVPQYQYDIFVSYAHVDNEKFAGADKGWVTTLVDTLKIFLAQKIGSADAYSLWLDDILPGHISSTYNSIQYLENSAIFLLILSPAYLKSEQCRLELNAFLAKVSQNSGRVFIVEYQAAERIETLNDLRGYTFWEADPINGRPRALGFDSKHAYQYHLKVEDLAIDIVDQLEILKADTVHINNTSSPQNTIFLAEVSDDLSFQREELKRNLELQGLRVLPNKLYVFNTKEELKKSIDSDLQNSVLFVQLLSAIAPQRPPGMSTPQLQYDCAKELGLPILQWRDRKLKLNEITDLTQRKLLTGCTVMAVSMVEFQQQIMQTLEKLKIDDEKPSSTNGDFIFINAAPQELDLAKQVEKALVKNGFACSLPMAIDHNTPPAKIREDLDNNLQFCDAVIILNNINTDLVWVRQQVLQCRRAEGKRENRQALKAIAVYNHPDREKSPININLPNLHILDGSAPYPDTCVPTFIQVLQQ